ncbi:rhodanese-like domain-containing protein [Comamonas sp. NoAH]|uniref:rhodanese-like domain-containing protein n=1 Tax=Comamonas halotolerans TaxID=3041496 RepID=UPI0024E06BE5|nr:rhodanese-like domain-containing protein [Comamonas sp. NoAH]
MFYQVRPSLLDEWLGQFAGDAAKPVVLDVREKWECQLASIRPSEKFELQCIPMGEITSRLTELDPDRPIACLCHHGARSMSVAAYLAREGFESVANITGGIDAWSHERDPSVPKY